MVGPLELEDRTHKDLPRIPEGASWRCAVKIKKCRWLERSGCVGIVWGFARNPWNGCLVAFWACRSVWNQIWRISAVQWSSAKIPSPGPGTNSRNNLASKPVQLHGKLVVHA